MNLTLENAEDISEEKPTSIGKVLLRGDNILAISLPRRRIKLTNHKSKIHMKIII